MKDLLLYIARNLVADPASVSVNEIQGEQELTLELRVAPDDMGKVIGRQGRNAKELRTVVRSYAQRTGVKVSVDIVDLKNGRTIVRPFFIGLTVGFSMMCYTKANSDKTCFGERQLSGRMGK